MGQSVRYELLTILLFVLGVANATPYLSVDSVETELTDTIVSADNKDWKDLKHSEDRKYLEDNSEDFGEEAEVIDSVLLKVPNIGRPSAPDPIRATWLAMVFPGAGQIYNHKYWKLPIIYGGYLGCVYALNWNSQMLKDYSQAYLDIMDDDPNTKSYEKMLPMGYDISGKEQRFKDIFKNKKNYFRKYRDMSIFAFAGVYLLSVVDAYVDAELSCFDISRDLSFHWEPSMLNHDNKLQRRYAPTSWGLLCSLSF